MSAAVQVDTDKLCTLLRKIETGMPVHTCPFCKTVGVINQKARHLRSAKCRKAAIPIEIAALEAKIAELRAEHQKIK